MFFFISTKNLGRVSLYHLDRPPVVGGLCTVIHFASHWEEIENKGEKKFIGTLTRDDGSESGKRMVTAQVCDVHRPLLSVKGMCRSGHRVIFDDEGSYVENKVTLERLKIDEVDGEYVIDMWVKTNGDEAEGTFGRPR